MNAIESGSPSLASRVTDACWRAAAYCLHPRVIALSFLPLLLVLLVLAGLGWFFWTDAVTTLAESMTQWAWTRWILDSVADWQLPISPRWLAGLLLLLVTVPLVIVSCLLLVAVFMTPAVVRLVGQRRFPQLEARQTVGWVASLAWSVGATLVAAAAFLFTLPLWFFPPFALVLPPLIWGWLTYRVMAFDALSYHATSQERQALFKQHRWPLLTIGIVAGFLGAAPTMLWAMSAITAVFAPFMIALSIWMYTLVFAFASLWFCHYLLQALQDMRQNASTGVVLQPSASPPLSLPDLADQASPPSSIPRIEP